MTPDSYQRLLAPLATIPASQVCNGDADWFPSVDILDDAEEYLFRIDLPEMKPEDVRVMQNPAAADPLPSMVISSAS